VKPWARYTLAVTLGLAAGVSLAVYRVRGGLAAGQITNGPWATAKTYGSTDADALTRARVALSGLLALPAKEALYFTAKTDSAGQPLDGRCTYRLMGGAPVGAWWSVTLYEGAGWLVKNPVNRWSVGSGAFPGSRIKEWLIYVGPKPHGSDEWIPTANVPNFDLTFRLYQAPAEIVDAPQKALLPRIDRVTC
jgi:hypothetical protein